jgi:hypothetical protein
VHALSNVFMHSSHRAHIVHALSTVSVPSSHCGVTSTACASGHVLRRAASCVYESCPPRQRHTNQQIGRRARRRCRPCGAWRTLVALPGAQHVRSRRLEHHRRHRKGAFLARGIRLTARPSCSHILVLPGLARTAVPRLAVPPPSFTLLCVPSCSAHTALPLPTPLFCANPIDSPRTAALPPLSPPLQHLRQHADRRHRQRDDPRSGRCAVLPTTAPLPWRWSRRRARSTPSHTRCSRPHRAIDRHHAAERLTAHRPCARRTSSRTQPPSNWGPRHSRSVPLRTEACV